MIENDLPKISVVIPTYNRSESLEKILPTYLASNIVGEVIIIDDGSIDQTYQMILKYEKIDLRVKGVHFDTNKGMVKARNIGIDHAKFSLILLSEDDLTLSPGSLKTLVKHMQETDADVIAGRRIWMRLGESEKEALLRANKYRGPIVSTQWLEHHSHAVAPRDVQVPLVNATMLIKRELLETIRFSEEFKGNAWRDESDFQICVLEKGFRIYYCPHSIFFHHNRLNIGRGKNRLMSDLIFLQWIYKNNVLFLKRHREYLQNNYSESLLFGSPYITSIPYLIYRSLWLLHSEIGRIIYLVRTR